MICVCPIAFCRYFVISNCFFDCLFVVCSFALFACLLACLLVCLFVFFADALKYQHIIFYQFSGLQQSRFLLASMGKVTFYKHCSNVFLFVTNTLVVAIHWFIEYCRHNHNRYHHVHIKHFCL